MFESSVLLDEPVCREWLDEAAAIQPLLVEKSSSVLAKARSMVPACPRRRQQAPLKSPATSLTSRTKSEEMSCLSPHSMFMWRHMVQKVGVVIMRLLPEPSSSKVALKCVFCVCLVTSREGRVHRDLILKVSLCNRIAECRSSEVRNALAKEPKTCRCLPLVALPRAKAQSNGCVDIVGSAAPSASRHVVSRWCLDQSGGVLACRRAADAGQTWRGRVQRQCMG